MSELGILLADDRDRTTNDRVDRSKGLDKLFVFDLLVSIYIQAPHHSNDFSFRCVVAVLATEMDQGVECYKTISVLVDRCKRNLVRPVIASKQISFYNFYLLVKLDLLLNQKRKLSFHLAAQHLILGTVS